VSYGEILTALPFLNTLAVKSLSGHELRDTIFHGLSEIKEAEGRYLQVCWFLSFFSCYLAWLTLILGCCAHTPAALMLKSKLTQIPPK
jgi:hypothetical protein